MDQNPKPQVAQRGTGESRTPAVLSLTPNALELLRAFRRRWVLALSLAVVLAGVTGGVVWLVAPPARFVARAQLFVSASPPRILFPTADQMSDGGAYQRRQLALLKTRAVLMATMRRPGIADLKSLRDAPDPLDWLEKNVQAEYAGGGELLRISMTGDDAQEITSIVNALVDAYMQEIVETERSDRLKRTNDLKDIHTSMESGLDSQRKTLKRLAEDVGSTDAKTIEMKRQFAMERLQVHQKELLQVQSDLRKADVDVTLHKGRAKTLQDSPIPDADVDAYLAKDPTIVQTRKEIADLDDRILKNTVRLRDPNDPWFPEARKQLADLQASEKSQRARMRPQVVEVLRAKLTSEAQATLAATEEKIELWKAREKGLVSLIDVLQGDDQTFKKTTVNLENLRRELDLSESMNKVIAETVKKMEFEANVPSRVHILEAAEVPRTKDEKARMRMVGWASLAAFALVVGGISFWEFHARRVGSVEQIVSGLGMTLVGALPPPPQRNNRFVGKWNEQAEAAWQSRLTESIDSARTMLLYRAKLENLHVVMITSAVSGEGKTSVSCHLATSLARAGHKTLLIDCDLRRPAAHRLFDLPAEPGLSELLRGEASAAEVLQSTPIDDLSMIAAGTWDSKATRALAQGRIASHFEEFKKHYEFIIVDSSPVLPVVDAMLVGKHVDGVLFSVLRDVSRLPTVYAAHQRMAALGVRMLGAIVNGTSEACYGYKYSYRTTTRE